MKKYLLLLVSIFFLFPVSTFALDLKLIDEKYINVCNSFSWVLPSYDNNGKNDGYLFYGSEIFKLDLNNEMTFTKTSAELSEIRNNIYIRYEYDDISNFMIFYGCDSNDNVVFEHKYPGPGRIGFTMESFDDNGVHDGYIVLLFSESSELAVDPGEIMIKLDLSGNIVWEKYIDSIDYFGDLIYVDKKKITARFSFSDMGLSKYDNNDNVVWTKEFDINGRSLKFSYDASGILDGIVVIGDTNNDEFSIIKYDLSGNEVFKKVYSGYYFYYFNVFMSSKLPNGMYDGYMVTVFDNNGKFFLLKLNYSGNIVWKQEISPGNAIVRNYDSTGAENGYLVFYFFPPKRVDMSFDATLQPYNLRKLAMKEIGKECRFYLAKYMYENYLVKKDEDEKGKITISNSMAYPGEIVKVSVTPKEGYTLKRIVVMDENGKEIEVSKDGTFVMPEGKVTVTAIYNRITNPKTVSACYVVLGIILLISIGTLIVNKKKEA